MMPLLLLNHNKERSSSFHLVLQHIILVLPPCPCWHRGRRLITRMKLPYLSLQAATLALATFPPRSCALRAMTSLSPAATTARPPPPRPRLKQRCRALKLQRHPLTLQTSPASGMRPIAFWTQVHNMSKVLKQVSSALKHGAERHIARPCSGPFVCTPGPGWTAVTRLSDGRLSGV